MIDISTDKVCLIIARAREFHAQEAGGLLSSGSNPTDQDIAFDQVLENKSPDPDLQAVIDIINGLNDDEKVELVALTWIGRGDFDRDTYQDALREARDQFDRDTARYLMGMPLLATYLEDGLNALGFTCAGFDADHL